jgi:dipeptidyl aminopeptidase/acylaminoacyl peptidase
MKIADALLYAPILGTSLAPAGDQVAVIVPKYESVSGTRRLTLRSLRLDGASAWALVGDADETFFDPAFAPDGSALAALREHPGGRDVAIYDPTTLVRRRELALPDAAVVLKWGGVQPRPFVLGNDVDGTRRVWALGDAGPAAITPERRRVADYALAPLSDRMAWLYGPPRSIGAPAEPTSLRVGDVSGAAWVEVDVPESPLGFLSFSPDGRWLAMLCRPVDEVLCSPRLWVIDLGEGLPPRRLMAGSDGWITAMEWCADGRALIVSEDYGVNGRLVRASLDGDVEVVGPADTYLSGVRCARGSPRWVFLQQDGGQTQHLRLMEDSAASSRRISRFNQRIDDMGLRGFERFEWRAPDGLALEGLLLRPAGDPPYPMITWLHGGPAEHNARTFSTYWQVLAGAGFAIFAPNFRGSTGRGDRFLGMLRGGLCGPDVADVDAGVRRLIVSGFAHRRQVGVMGWSYGGALALSIAAEHAWVRAIVAGAPVVDWLTVFGARTWPWVTRAYFDADPWLEPERYDAASPARRLGRVQAPALFLHGELDDRVPPSQSRLAWHLLTARGVVSDLRLFPGEGHVFGAPWAVQEMLVRTISWFQGHLRV